MQDKFLGPCPWNALNFQTSDAGSSSFARTRPPACLRPRPAFRTVLKGFLYCLIPMLCEGEAWHSFLPTNFDLWWRLPAQRLNNEPPFVTGLYQVLAIILFHFDETCNDLLSSVILCGKAPRVINNLACRLRRTLTCPIPNDLLWLSKSFFHFLPETASL